jgi:hypothetical protein
MSLSSNNLTCNSTGSWNQNTTKCEKFAIPMSFASNSNDIIKTEELSNCEVMESNPNNRPSGTHNHSAGEVMQDAECPPDIVEPQQGTQVMQAATTRSIVTLSTQQ